MGASPHAAVTDRVIGVDPSAEIAALAKQSAEIIIPTPEEVAALIQATPARYRAATWLAAGEGSRQGETFGLATDRVTAGAPVLGA
jgi:hypothetical protein